MCVNDIVVQGAKPLFFLDYLACDKVVPEKIEAIVAGIAEGCHQAGCALIGGETAEMPGMYAEGEYDIAGFTVGVVDKSKIINGADIAPGDAVIGLSSSGVHSNGFSLVRKLLLEQEGYSLQDSVPELGGTLGDALLAPTKIYVKPLLAFWRNCRSKAWRTSPAAGSSKIFRGCCRITSTSTSNTAPGRFCRSLS